MSSVQWDLRFVTAQENVTHVEILPLTHEKNLIEVFLNLATFIYIRLPITRYEVERTSSKYQ